MKNKRTDVDFSKHKLEITKNDNILIHDFGVPGSYSRRITFVNMIGVMVVVGDYGNWIFNREFHPSNDGEVSDGYWLEKLRTKSDQKGTLYDPDETEKEIRRLLYGGLEEDGFEGSELEETKEYFENCLNYAGDEFDYKCCAYNNKPSFLDYEYIVFCTETNHWLLVIFDAFEEICKRLKEEKSDES